MPIAAALLFAVHVSAHVGMSPLLLHVEVRQDRRLTGEICLVLDGPEQQRSCWQNDKPAALTDRTFTLHEAGIYVIYAETGRQQSNQETIEVMGEEKRK